MPSLWARRQQAADCSSPDPQSTRLIHPGGFFEDAAAAEDAACRSRRRDRGFGPTDAVFGALQSVPCKVQDAAPRRGTSASWAPDPARQSQRGRRARQTRARQRAFA